MSHLSEKDVGTCILRRVLKYNYQWGILMMYIELDQHLKDYNLIEKGHKKIDLRIKEKYLLIEFSKAINEKNINQIDLFSEQNKSNQSKNILTAIDVGSDKIVCFIAKIEEIIREKEVLEFWFWLLPIKGDKKR